VNERIRIREIRVIDETGQHLGIMPTADALKMAYDKDLDLVEIAPEAAPPVCKIMSFSKYKYEQHKKEQKEKKLHLSTKTKELRLRPLIDEHDIHVKLNHAKELLQKGNKVMFNVFFRGRENIHKEIGFQLMTRIQNELVGVSKVEKPLKLQGKRLSLILSGKNP
jgi:translation initiation factor IF-3